MQTIVTILAVVAFSIFLLVIFGGIFAAIVDITHKPSPEDLAKTWRSIYLDYRGDWDRGRVTLIYHYVKDNEIIGKVTKTEEGLYLTTMCNGTQKEFMYEHDATKYVENYKPIIIK